MSPNHSISNPRPSPSSSSSINSATLDAVVVADGGIADPLEEMNEPFEETRNAAVPVPVRRNSNHARNQVSARDPSASAHDHRQFDDNRDLEKGAFGRSSREGNEDDDDDDDGTIADATTPPDLERGPGEISAANPSPTEQDPNLVTWDGPHDKTNPKNWTFGKKWRTMTMVSLFTLMSPVASSMLAPALPQISRDLGIEEGSVIQEMTLSIFILAYAIGPLFLAPLSEIYGRQPVLQLANMFFLIFNVACSRVETKTQMLVCRFFAGLGGSAPLAIGGGTISDPFPPEQRGLAMSMYTLAPLTGPAIGPVAGAWIAQTTSWRWVFYSTSIVDGVVQLFGFIYLRETYAARILGNKAARMRKETGNDKLHTAFDHPDRTLTNVILHGLRRPLVFLATEPIVQVCAAYMAILYGTMYLTLATFAEIWTTNYGMSVGIGGLNYFAIGIGFTIGTQLGARMLDTIYKKLRARNGGVGTPEMRMPLMMVTAAFVPMGLIIFGWTADKTVFWLVPDIGIAIFAFGVIGSFLTISTYLVDNYTIYAASAIGAGASLRSLAGFGFPLFAQPMFKALGTGWGNSLLALIAFIFLPSPFLFYKYGPWLRERSKYAKAMTKGPDGGPSAAKPAQDTEKKEKMESALDHHDHDKHDTSKDDSR